MNINAPIILKINDIEKIERISNHKLMLIAFSINSGIATTIKETMSILDINKEEMTTFVELLKDFLTHKDLKVISRLNSTQLLKQEEFDEQVEEVIEHLNMITNSKRTVTKERKALIIKWLRQGFSLNSFRHVNLYFYHSWHDKIEFSKYITPETLYNGKFISRVETAENEFKKIALFSDDIIEICKGYHEFFRTIVIAPPLLSKNKIEFNEYSEEKVCKYIPFDIQERIAFWRKRGISKEDILLTIQKTIEQWNQKEEFRPHISLKKILDNKFNDRLRVAKSLLNVSHDAKLNGLANWLNTNSES